MRLEIDTGVYRSAMDVCYDSNHTLVDAISDTAVSLAGCASMAGDDSGGQDWAASYDSVANDMVQASADLAGSMGAVANLLNASLVNHEGADYGARLSGGGPNGGGDDGDPDPDHGNWSLSPATVPSASGGSGSPPDGWQWLVEHLEGLLWPNADTDMMRSAGTAWTNASTTLTAMGYAMSSASVDIATQTSPEAGPASKVCTELEQHCNDLATAYTDVGKACTDYANQVDEHHQEVISTCEELLAWTVADEVTGAILSFFTAGAAEVAAQLVEAGIMARYAEKVISILRRLIELARAAARLISKGLGKIADILGRLKRLLNAKALSALEKFASKELKDQLAKVRDLLKLSEKGKGHTLERHVGLSDKELAERLANNPKLKNASSYTDEGTATREINRVLGDQENAIQNWLNSGGKKLELDGDAGRVIGRTVDAGGGVSNATHLRVVLIRDPTAPGGYTILTSFPK